MKILFVHQNFPGQFLHLAPALAARGHKVLALTDEKNQRPSPVQVVRYKAPGENTVRGLARSYADHAERGWLAARGCRALRDQHGYVPDLIFGHSGWGETLFLREIWPEAKLLVYAELLYRTRGHDVGFDPEITPDSDEGRVSTLSRSAHLIQGLVQADAGLSPTRYQAESFPPELRQKLTVIHDGIDTDIVRPNPEAVLRLTGLPVLRAGDEVLADDRAGDRLGGEVQHGHLHLPLDALVLAHHDEHRGVGDVGHVDLAGRRDGEVAAQVQQVLEPGDEGAWVRQLRVDRRRQLGYVEVIDLSQLHQQLGRGRALVRLDQGDVAGRHPELGRHLRLRQLRPCPDLARIDGGMKDSGTLALGMGQGFAHRLDQIFAKAAHFLSFHAAFSAAARDATTRFSSGLMSSFAFLA